MSRQPNGSSPSGSPRDGATLDRIAAEACRFQHSWRLSVFRGGVAVGALIVIVFLLIRAAGEIHWGIDLAKGVGVATLLVLSAQLLGALRWSVILGGSGPPLSRLVRLYLGAAFFSVFLPSSTGGDLYRTVEISRSLGDLPRGLTTTLVDRACGLLAVVAWFLVGVVLFAATGREYPSLAGLGLNRPLAAIVLAFCIVTTLVGVTSRTAWVSLLRARTVEAIGFVAHNMASFYAIALIFGISLLMQGLYILAWASLSTGVGLGLSLPFLILTVPMVSVATMLPVSISGLGIREGVWILLTRDLGVPIGEVVVFSLSYFVSFILVGLLGAAFLIQSGPEGRGK